MPKKNIYFGKLLAELAQQNDQARFVDPRETPSCMVQEIRRQQYFVVKFSNATFEYNLEDFTYHFYEHVDGRDAYIAAGWDGLTVAQKMAFLGEVYEFMYLNGMTNSSLDEFIDYLAKSPV